MTDDRDNAAITRARAADTQEALDDDEKKDEQSIRQAVLRRWIADLGPIPRRVFNPIAAYNKQKQALDELSDFDLDALTSIAKSSERIQGDKFKMAHLLLLIVASSDLSDYALAPSSAKVGRMLMEKMMRRDLAKAQTLMGKMAGAHLGLVFEPYVHFVLQQGGSFTIRDLQTHKPEAFRMQKHKVLCEISNEEIFKKKKDLFHKDTYYIPTDPTFAVVDSWTKEAMFQVTVSDKHPIKSASKPFLALRSATSSGGPNRLVFVVPANLYDDFPLQDLVDSKGVSRKSGPRSGWNNNVKQYVMGLK